MWQLGKPVGRGEPWKESQVTADEPSDPYLIGFYDRKILTLSHLSDSPVNISIEVEPVGHGPWMTYKEVTVNPGDVYSEVFPDHFQARWIRFRADADCVATAWLIYE